MFVRISMDADTEEKKEEPAAEEKEEEPVARDPGDARNREQLRDHDCDHTGQKERSKRSVEYTTRLWVQTPDARKAAGLLSAALAGEPARKLSLVGITGTNGKTTTTSMVGTVMAEGGLDPTVIIGGRLNAWGTNAKLGQGDFVVAEADESDGTFLLYSPTISLVTNIDTEHLDFYKDRRISRNCKQLEKTFDTMLISDYYS